MESFFGRYRNLLVLLTVLLVQVIGLAVQVRRPEAGAVSLDRTDGRGVRLIRLWAASLVTPFEQAMHGSREGVNGLWNNYIDLRHIREENKALKQDLDRMRLEQATLVEDARQAQRLQGLLGFRESYIYSTLPAQVIGTSGSTQSHVIFIDKGSDDGLKPDMAVVTPDGIVGKVREVFGHTAQVLEINDQTSGAGVVLETTRIRGILRGNAAGQPQVINILADSRIQPGEKVLTAGGDQIFPRGLPVGVVEKVTRDNERSGFIEVAVKPAANLQLLDEVLVITSMDAHLSPKEQADLATSEDLKGAEVAAEAERKKAAAEMAERLPGLKDASAPDAKTADASNPNDPKAADKPAPPQTVPKPLPAKHPDRFSPGAPPEAVPDFDSPNAKPITQPAEPKADAPAAQPKTGASSAPKTAAPKSTTGTAPKTGPGHAGPGHAGPGRMR